MTQPLPKISVIIPVYNVLPYLGTCLDSILNQTYGELEIICVNDGSTDGSDLILREYAEKDSRIVVIEQPNQGLSAARNHAMDIAQGEYIAFIDSDDWLDIHALDILAKKASKEQLDMLMFQAQLFNDETQETSFYAYTDYSAFLSPETREKTFSYVDFSTDWNKLWPFPVMAWSTLWKRKFLERIHLRFPPGLCFEDNLFFRKAFFKASRISILEKPFYYYRQRSTSITGNKATHFKDLCSIISLEAEFMFRELKEESLKRHFLSFSALPHLYMVFWNTSLDAQINNFSTVKTTFDELLAHCQDNDFYESLYLGIRKLVESMAPYSHANEWMESFFLSTEDIIRELRELEPFYYKFHSEPSRNSFIEASSQSIFLQANLPFKTYQCLTQDVINYNLVYQGDQESTEQKSISDLSMILCDERIKHCIILPQNFQDCLELIYLFDERFTVFCKDWQSLCYCKANNYRARFLLANDLVKSLDIREFIGRSNFETPSDTPYSDGSVRSLLVTLPDKEKALLLIASPGEQKIHEYFEIIDLLEKNNSEEKVFQWLEKEQDALVNNLEWQKFLQRYMKQNEVFIEKQSSKRIKKINEFMRFISLFIILPKPRRKFLDSHTFKF